MKSKKTLLIIIIILLLLVIAGLVGYIVYQNITKTEEYDKSLKKYERIVVIANKVNSIIDEQIQESKEFLASNPDVGSDTTMLQNLEYTVRELETLKIEIEEKSKKLDELNNSIEKMEHQIKQLDEELLVKKSEDSTQASVVAGKNEIKISENSNLSIIISNIDVLTKEVNNAVQAEAERKAEEERKAKEEADRKAAQEALANVEKGDFSYFAGTYVEIYSNISTLTLDKDGRVTIDGNVFTNKPLSITKMSDGSYWCLTRVGSLYDDGFIIYPVGVGSQGDTNKVRITVIEALGAVMYQK